MCTFKALVAFDTYNRELLQTLSCLVGVRSKQDSEKRSILNYVDTADSNADPVC